MPIATSTLPAIGLLVFAASVAAFVLSLWSRLFAGRSALTQWTSGIGVVALLAAATVYFLSVISPAMLGLVAVQEDPAASGTSRIGGFPEQLSRSTGEAATTQVSDNSRRLSSQSSATHANTVFTDQSGPRESTGAAVRSAGAKSRVHSPPQSARASHLVSILESQPWAATDCVFQIQPDPAQRDLWWLENECDVPVGIVAATCAGSQVDCAAAGSTLWTYAADGMYLPSKQQRSITYAEQTLRGNQLRFIACVITSQIAIDLLASDRSVASRQWREALSSSIGNDVCISQVRRLSEAGKRTRAPIDELAGANVPGRARQSRD